MATCRDFPDSGAATFPDFTADMTGIHNTQLARTIKHNTFISFAIKSLTFVNAIKAFRCSFGQAKSA
jgi:hypothetical protein